MAALSHMTSDKMILNATPVFILNVSPKFEIVVPNLRPSYILMATLVVMLHTSSKSEIVFQCKVFLSV